MEEEFSYFIRSQEQEPSVPRLLDQIKTHLPAPLAAPPKTIILFKDSNNSILGYIVKLDFWIIKHLLLKCLDKIQKLLLQT